MNVLWIRKDNCEGVVLLNSESGKKKEKENPSVQKHIMDGFQHKSPHIAPGKQCSDRNEAQSHRHATHIQQYDMQIKKIKKSHIHTA